jgi:hypothetical protein
MPELLLIIQIAGRESSSQYKMKASQDHFLLKKICAKLSLRVIWFHKQLHLIAGLRVKTCSLGMSGNQVLIMLNKQRRSATKSQKVCFKMFLILKVFIFTILHGKTRADSLNKLYYYSKNF